MGSDLSDAAFAKYYAANLAQFTADCVSQIVTDTQAACQPARGPAQRRGLLRRPWPRPAPSTPQTRCQRVARWAATTPRPRWNRRSSSRPSRWASRSAPVQDQSTGRWVVYEVTSQSLEPLSAAKPVVREELLQATANVNRVNQEIVAFARRSDVSVDPQYGTWKTLTIVPPVGPPDSYLLPAVSTATLPTSRPGWFGQPFVGCRRLVERDRRLTGPGLAWQAASR